MSQLSFTCQTREGSTKRDIAVSQLVVAGWTGRDRDRMERHIAELEALGVRRPATTPVFYRVAAARVAFADAIQVTGETSSGEVETLIVNDGDRLWAGLASDHTDREVEAYGITVSKQMCDKPCASVLWPLEEVAPHWDRLRISAVIEENGGRVLYQQGEVAGMLKPQDLIDRFQAAGGAFVAGTAMLCGTLPAIGGVRPAAAFEMALEDPILGRSITHGYRIEVLPIAEA